MDHKPISRGYDSVIRRVLEISEILELVFSFLEDKDNANNALVCKRWSDPALNIMSRNIESPALLFGLLAPIKPIRMHSQYVSI